MDLSLPIDVVENISEKDFKEKYFDPQIPVVIKGLTNGTFAGKNWSLDYFKRTMGHHTVPVYDNRNPNKGSAFTQADLQMKFGEFLDEIRKEGGNNIRMFLFDLFKLNPELSKEFPCPDLASGILGKLGRMFFAGKNTTVRIHYDIDVSNVFHTHFGGKKRVVLFSPAYNSVLASKLK
ncbi:MAG: cupin-like domain-containing protein, partial [Bacteroidia bacterium]|nr:cupin-like domain-containing protein [Bacteroidia bacterium]